MSRKSAENRKFVEPLIEHLRASGTGQAKLIAIAETAEQVSGPDEFLQAVKTCVPPGTFDKITAYIESARAKPKPSSGPTEPEQPESPKSDDAK